MSDDAVYRLATTAADKRHVMRLRDLVYVREQGRLATPSDMSQTFDRFNDHAAYVLAEIDGESVGTIKVVNDSPLGLPCEDVVDLDEFRFGHHVVELGHLMTDPRIRGQRVGLGLMRSGLVHAVRQFGATRLVGDFFADGPSALRSFYQALGFIPIGAPYRDERFSLAPLSVVAGLDLAGATARAKDAAGSIGGLMRFFFDDYEALRQQHLEAPGRSAAAAADAAGASGSRS